MTLSNSDLKPYMLVAGHCFKRDLGTNWIARDSAGGDHAIGVRQNSFYGTVGDMGIIRAAGSFWAAAPGWQPESIVFTSGYGTTWNPDYPTWATAWSYTGLYVCHTGAATGTSCGAVDGTNVSITYDDGTVLQGMTRLPVCGDHGDSGGPFCRSNTAYGVLSGGTLGTCSQIFYTEAIRAASSLNVHIATAG